MKARGGWLLVIWLISIISYRGGVETGTEINCAFIAPSETMSYRWQRHRGLHHRTYFYVIDGQRGQFGLTVWEALPTSLHL